MGLEAPTTSAASGVAAATYDPIRGGVVGVTASATWFLASAADHWVMIGGAPPTSSLPATMAFEARSGDLSLISQYGNAARFTAGTWFTSLSPGTGYSIVADARRGTSEIIAATRPSYEHINGGWFQRDPLPVAVDGPAIYNAASGKVIVIGTVNHSRVMLERTFVGAAPLDGCAGGDDDMDGLIDCDDPDCWWSCRPACPPFASCP